MSSVSIADAVRAACPPSRVRLVDDPATGPRLEVYVRDRDLRGWHWDWLQTLTREHAEVWRLLLAPRESTTAEYRALARENYGLLLMLQDEVGDVSADALRATAESRVVRQTEKRNKVAASFEAATGIPLGTLPETGE